MIAPWWTPQDWRLVEHADTQPKQEENENAEQ
jgi:hypothetical protein